MVGGGVCVGVCVCVCVPDTGCNPFSQRADWTRGAGVTLHVFKVKPAVEAYRFEYV